MNKGREVKANLIFGIGTDIVEISRIEEVFNKNGNRFTKKFFTAFEEEYCLSQKNPHPHYAARFAAKEAVVKALGTGFRKMKFNEIEIVNDCLGKPEVRLSGQALAIAKKLGIQEIKLSLSHTRDNAVAFAVAYGKAQDL